MKTESIEDVVLSLVVPMYNEEAVIGLFFERIIPCLEQITVNFEVICVNDGSSDKTWEQLQIHAAQDDRIKLLGLSRNFGKEAALCAGLDFSTGQAVVPIDCDLQDPPELIGEMYKKWQEGAHVVLARRADRSSDSFMKRWTSRQFYSIMQLLSDINIPVNVGDFRLIDRRVVDCLKRYPERNRFNKGLFASLGFKEAVVEYTRPERARGVTKWNYFGLYKLAVDGIVSFTSFPLKLWSYIGAAVAMYAFVYGGYLIIKTLMFGVDTPGYASLMVVVLFMSGLILLSLGIIGEYLARIFIEVKHRPLYIVMEKYGFDNVHERNA